MRWESSSSYAPRTAQRGFAPHHAVSRGATAFTAKKVHARRVLFPRSGWTAAQPPIRHASLRLAMQFCAKTAPRGVPRGHRFHHKKSPTQTCRAFLVVGAGGFGPPKALPADLQSVPFGHSGTLPYEIECVRRRGRRRASLELVNGVEPSTC